MILTSTSGSGVTTDSNRSAGCPSPIARARITACPTASICAIHSVTTGRSSGTADGHWLGPRNRIHAGSSGPGLDRLVLGADVDLIAPVADAVGVLHPEARVATEVAGVGVGDLEPIGLGKGEEPARQVVHPLLERGVDAVSGQLHEPDLVARRGELVRERDGVG